MTTNIPSLLAELRRRDIHVRLDGDRLHCNGPTGALTPELRESLRANKEALLDYLRHAYALTRQQRAIIPLQPLGSRLPLFAIGGHNGDVFCFHHLARCLGTDQPFYGLQPPGADGEGKPLQTVEEIAAYFVDQIHTFYPDGPYRLIGYCAGGTIAFELAQQLERAGDTVRFLGLISSPHPHQLRRLPRVRRYLAEQFRKVRQHAGLLLSHPWRERWRYLTEVLHRRRAQQDEEQRRGQDPVLLQGARVQQATLRALARYRPSAYQGVVHLFLPGREWSQSGGLAAHWGRLASQLKEHYGPAGCSSDDMLKEIHAPIFAETFRRCLDGEGERPNSPLHGVDRLQPSWR